MGNGEFCCKKNRKIQEIADENPQEINNFINNFQTFIDQGTFLQEAHKLKQKLIQKSLKGSERYNDNKEENQLNELENDLLEKDDRENNNNPQKTNDSYLDFFEKNLLPKPYGLNIKLIKKKPVNESEKDRLESDDHENIFKNGLDRPILHFYDKVVDENPKFCYKFQKSRNSKNRNYEEENLLSPCENENANEDKENELLPVESEKTEEERDAKNDEKNNQILECAQETLGN